ncbi:hypothetical protein ACTXJR_05750 [Glutamicibacter ardleyensis]|uniref:hypothetical protein n=1 Tax=Glutamicibacter ardleyensis TaxID=225894 RepID=UPI003FD39845
MTNFLPGNPFADSASHFVALAHEARVTNNLEKSEHRAAVAQAYATLANAYETRTATLAALQVSNHSAAVRGYGVMLEDAPGDLMEFLSEKAEELAERLGKSE